MLGIDGKVDAEALARQSQSALTRDCPAKRPGRDNFNDTTLAREIVETEGRALFRLTTRSKVPRRRSNYLSWKLWKIPRDVDNVIVPIGGVV